MGFIRNYNGAMQILSEIGTGTCKGSCKSVWIRNLKYSLHLFSFQTPLKLLKILLKNILF
jgi:hypothetical protein